MVSEKKFYLKIRKDGLRWGCSCCQPCGRQLRRTAGHRRIKQFIKSRDQAEQRLFSFIESDSE